MLNLKPVPSAVSRTNQIKVLDTPQEMADHLFYYLFKKGKGIEHFILDQSWRSAEGANGESSDNYRDRDLYIKEQVKKRMAVWQDTSEPKYFVAYAGGQTHVYYLSPNKEHSGWKELFCENDGGHRSRILNLLFKVHILSKGTSIESINGFEQVTLPHTKWLDEERDLLFVWGLQAQLNFNRHQVITLHLKKDYQIFTPKDDYRTLDGENLGEIQVYNGKRYYKSYKKLDARKKNDIFFMDFSKKEGEYGRFKKCLVYYYQMLISELETLFDESGIKHTALDFQAQCYLDNSYIDDTHLAKVQSFDTIVVINNTGQDMTDTQRMFLRAFLKHQGVADITFYQEGRTINRFIPVQGIDDEDHFWQIQEVTPWSEISPESGNNYLVLNLELDKDSGSMAFQDNQGNWYPTFEWKDNARMDFYSQFKKRFSYLETGQFYSMQGINVKRILPVGGAALKKSKQEEKKTDKKPAKGKGKPGGKEVSIMMVEPGDTRAEDIQRDCTSFLPDQYLSMEDNIIQYTIHQHDTPVWEKFCIKHRIKVTPEFQRVMIEMGIKSWMRAALLNQEIGLPLNDPRLPEKRFYAIYVRSPKNGEPQAVAVDYLHKDGCIRIMNVIRDMAVIERKFPFLRRRKVKNEDRLYNDQQLYVDEECRERVSYYTDDFFTPTLIGRKGILEELSAGTLVVSRSNRGENSSRLLPLVTYYNGEITPINSVRNMICLDKDKHGFIQYYIPPYSELKGQTKHGFRVYHIIGYKDGNPLTTQELLDHPLVSFHFNTLTQNLLKISENSPTSLLLKVARVLIEN